MKFEEYYDKMSFIDVQRLNKIWGIVASDYEPGIRKSYLKKYVLEFFFDRGYFKKCITDNKVDIFIGEKPKEYLIYKALGFELPYYEVKKELRERYILFEDEIPDDFKEIILSYIRSMTISFIINEPIAVKYTPFLKLLLMINYVHKRKLDILKMFKVVDIEDGILKRRYFIDYLRTRHLTTDDGKYLNNPNLCDWINNRSDSISDFYRFLLTQLNAKKLLEFFDIIIKIFQDSAQWIKVQQFKKIFESFEREVKIGKKLGLIEIEKYKNETYMKLSPEAWYMITSERPIKWRNKEILITALKEIFVPYNFDPFIIQIVDYFRDRGKDKNVNKYYDDYFIISNIGNLSKIESDLFNFIDLIEYIKEYCEDIPSIIRDEVLVDGLV